MASVNPATEEVLAEVAGQPGVEHAIDLLVAQLRRTMQLLGVTTVAELRRNGDDLVVPA